MPSPRILLLTGMLLSLALSGAALADGVLRPPRDYKGSLEERAQEAIIVFHITESGEGVEDLILKVRVEGDV
ncbi:MAG: hypothetical protein ACYS47_16320, partial [Planctomycetota bacterium]